MSYEVYIDIRHHPRHNEDDELVESKALRLADEDLTLTQAFDAGDRAALRRALASVLRDYADELDEEAA